MGYFEKFNKKAGIPFMEGREKKSLKSVLDQQVHIEDFGFINGEDGEYAVLKLVEFDDAFYFGNQIVTDTLKEIQDDGQSEALKDVPVVFTLKMSKKNREYIAIEFIED